MFALAFSSPRSFRSDHSSISLDTGGVSSVEHTFEADHQIMSASLLHKDVDNRIGQADIQD